MPRRIVVTSALPYANGPIHIGHLVEYIQTDIWVRFQKMLGNRCLYFCADDTHGTPVMISARAEKTAPEELIRRFGAEHQRDFADFLIEFDNYYTTHSDENRHFSELIFRRLQDAGSIVKRKIDQAYCQKCGMFLPDRYIRGTCPRCGAGDQYGDSCESCGGTHLPTDLKNARCATCKSPPVRKSSVHYFFKLADYDRQLRDLIAGGYAQRSVARKLDEWFDAGLRDWDITRDAPYFGFEIPGHTDKYFYVWLDAPVGYMASAKNYCDRNGIDFESLWPCRGGAGEYELYHFIGKDIMYFHALFWPAMLTAADIRRPDKLFVHGFLTVDGEKMSKSRGTFVKARTYLEHLDPEYLRYYYAGKLTGGIEDIDLSREDFVNKVNSELVGKFANLASRSAPMLNKRLDGRLGRLDETGRGLVEEMASGAAGIIEHYENLNYAAVVRRVRAYADAANRYVERQKPWETIKTDPEKTRAALTAVLNATRVLATYLRPVLPAFSGKVRDFLKAGELTFDGVGSAIEDRRIGPFCRLFERIDMPRVDGMIGRA
jgi:methionyl-tRNA synthetase